MTQIQLRSVIALILGVGTLTALNRSTVHAQGIAVTTTNSTGPDLSVQGHAETDVPADIAYLTISVISRAHGAAAAAQENAARTATLIRAIKSLKIAAQDIQTADYNVDRQFNTNRRTPVLIGYEVTNTVQVTLHDLSQAGRLIDLAAQSGATSITDLTYGLNDRPAAEKMALTLAVADARVRAEAIASAMNMTLGSLRSVSDRVGPPFQAQPYIMGGYPGGVGYPGGMAALPATKISPQEITVTADVTADYSLSAAP